MAPMLWATTMMSLTSELLKNDAVLEQVVEELPPFGLLAAGHGQARLLEPASRGRHRIVGGPEHGQARRAQCHDRPVADAVWQLYASVIVRVGPIPTLVEWDSDVPEWRRLKVEAAAAQRILDHAAFIGRRGHAA